METQRLKNIAIVILLLLNACLLLLLGYQHFQSRWAQADAREELRSLYAANQLTLSAQADLDQEPLSPLSLLRHSGTEQAIASSLLGGSTSALSQGGGIYSYAGEHGTIRFRSGGGFDGTGLTVPVEDIPGLAEHSAVCVPTMMPYITAFFMPRRKGDRPDVIPDGCVNFAFLGQFAETPRDTVFTTEYSVRTAMEAVYGLLGVDRGVPEVWGSVYDIRELLDSSVKLMDGKSPLEIQLPGPLNALKKPLLHFIKGTVVEKVLRDHDVLKEGML